VVFQVIESKLKGELRAGDLGSLNSRPSVFRVHVNDEVPINVRQVTGPDFWTLEGVAAVGMQ